ncbi:hypothetical protein FOMPIDRAFT_1084618, partial [Fomitopsis schrenkii]
LPTLDGIRAKTLAELKCDPCRWQSMSTLASLEGKKDVVTVAPTGSGKTLTFWMPLLFRDDGIQLVVTPLNILGTQNEGDLAKLGIAEGKYRAIVANPEEVMKPGGGFEKLWEVENFTSRLISVVWDEVHCASIWKSFRPEYKRAHLLRNFLPRTPFHLATATFPDDIGDDVMTNL